MVNLVRTLLGAESFIPHGHCYLWKPGLVGLHALSDSLIALAYYSIPLTLFYFIRKRQDLPFHQIFWLFGAFIIACGTTHFVEVWTLWHPFYWFAGVLKAITALISLYTAMTLVQLLPTALTLPSSAQLEAVNQELQREIVDRKRTEEALRQSQQLLDAFISSAPVGMTVLDSQLRFTSINEALAEINGIAADDHIGKTLWEIVPDLAPQQDQIVQHVLKTGEPMLYVEITGETRKLPGVVRTWLVSYFPICSSVDHLCSSAARPIGIGIVVAEITDRKRAEKELELRSIIVKNMAEGICLVRVVDGVIVYANPKFERMFGYETGELTGKHVSVVNYEDQHISAEAVHKAISDKVTHLGEASYEVRNVKKDGTPFWCRATSSTFDHPDYGTVLVAVQQDITDRKLAEEQVKTSLREKEVLLKEVHHRVKNNLQIVDSLLQMQARRTQSDSLAAILTDSRNRIASIALVHEKLYGSDDLANIDFAHYIPDLTAHLFDAYNVNSTAITLDTIVNDVSLDIETAIPCGLIINELVSNSLKYAFPHCNSGSIKVKFYAESSGALSLVVQDNGIGLPKHFSFENAKSLGLTLVRGLVEQLEGQIEVSSSQGTEFKITF